MFFVNGNELRALSYWVSEDEFVFLMANVRERTVRYCGRAYCLGRY